MFYLKETLSNEKSFIQQFIFIAFKIIILVGNKISINYMNIV